MVTTTPDEGRWLRLSEDSVSNKQADPGGHGSDGQDQARSPPATAWLGAALALRYLRLGIHFYWYRGGRRIAITSVSVTAVVYPATLSLFGATSLFALVLMLMMDHVLIIFLFTCVVAVRTVVPDMLIGELDAFVALYGIYIVAGWIGNPVITNLIASKWFRYRI